MMIKKVTGAGEPEEFGWEQKGYSAPDKGDPSDEGWKYSPIGSNNKEK